MGKICTQSKGCIVSLACEQTFAKKFVSCFAGGIYKKEHFGLLVILCILPFIFNYNSFVSDV